MAKSSKSILIASDMHCGSATSICSLEPQITELGTVHLPNKLQLALNEAWYNCIDELEQKPTLLVVNGEPCDGANKDRQDNRVGQQTYKTR